ncbi:ribosomal RNA-processing protein 8-like [Acanthaster planci]|uniref:Ribosomal RNA-processing protein 8 n=1 Tax=Acanthaster planci TaxID=133434 RepID=A0A8B7YE73_ACAPL|nr:ribosomal RNA-processing protein 8-like [Acanthaster planci]
MDFLDVCDAENWGDSSDAKDLHAKLFSPRNGTAVASPKSNKSNATRKKQTTVGEEQTGSKKAKNTKNQGSGNWQHGSKDEREASRLSEQSENAGTSPKNAKVKKKKKRQVDDSESRAPPKKQKVVQSMDDSITGEERDREHLQEPSKSEPLAEDQNVKMSKKKMRKRKPRNNKFKTAEFGYVAPQSKAVRSDTELKTPSQSLTGKFNPQNSELEGKADKNSEKPARKTSKKAKHKNAILPIEELNARTPSKHKVKISSEGEQLPTKNKGKKKLSTNFGKPADVGNEVEKQRTKPANKSQNVMSRINSVTPAKTEVTATGSTTACQREENSKMTDDQDEDSVSESDEPLLDPSARQALRSKMEAQLQSAHFRYLNEQLYKTTGSQAQRLMEQDREAFNIYHQGFSQQVRKWPVNPLDKFIEDLKSRPASLVVGDFGCGEARIAQSVHQTVHSFDLCALNEYVQVCNMEKVPVKSNSLDVAIFCLSLMGTNWISYLKEANRVLKMKGKLKIAEVASRFASVAEFLKILKQLGFKKESKDYSNKMFLMFSFIKEAPPKTVASEKGEVLRPCLYKRR